MSKKQKRCKAPAQEEVGDLWDHTAVAADSKLVGSLVVGKRTQEQTRTLVHDTKSRFRSGHLPVIFPDAYDGYAAAILEAFGRRDPHSRQDGRGRNPRPLVRWPLIRGTVRLNHGLSLLGDKQINTRVVERHNGTNRLRNRRKVRKTLPCSKARRAHRWRSWLSVTLDNFCRGHGSLQITQEAQVRHRSPARAVG